MATRPMTLDVTPVLSVNDRIKEFQGMSGEFEIWSAELANGTASEIMYNRPALPDTMIVAPTMVLSLYKSTM